MGKKDEKKAAAKAAKKDKQKQKSEKKKKKELGIEGTEDIAKIIAEIETSKPSLVNAVVKICEQPSPRAYCSITPLNNGEILMFGGEYYNGQKTFVYNDTYKCNMNKMEWKAIECPVSPKPRCSHQTAVYKDSVYMFGGEFSTTDEFYHFKDFWRFDLKSNTWHEIRANGQTPSPRSGHRMLVWRNLLVLFGGFCDTYRETRYYNDLYIYNFQENRWLQIVYSKQTDIPEGRSAFNFVSIQQNADFIFMYGGYAKIKDSSRTVQGKHYHDSWLLNMRPLISSRAAHPVWQRLRKTGNYPSIRSGTSMVPYKHLALMFGGVFDDDNGSCNMRSVFYNDLYAFDLNMKKWYAFSLKEKTAKAGKKREKNKAKSAKNVSRESVNEEDMEEVEAAERNTNKKGERGGEEQQGEEEEYDEEYNYQEITFGYIDEDGKLVRVKLIDDEKVNILPCLPQNIVDTPDTSNSNSYNDNNNNNNNCNDDINSSNNNDSNNSNNDINNSNNNNSINNDINNSNSNNSNNNNINHDDTFIEEGKREEGEDMICESIRKMQIKTEGGEVNRKNSENEKTNVTTDNLSRTNRKTKRHTKDEEEKEENDGIADKEEKEKNSKEKKQKREKISHIKYEKVDQGGSDGNDCNYNNNNNNNNSNNNNNNNTKDCNNTSAYTTNSANTASSISALREVMLANELPLPRINAHVFVLNNKLYVYGGLVEIGKKEVTLDDCWALNLVKREKWEKILPGSMDEQIWLESESEAGDEEEENEEENEEESEEEEEECSESDEDEKTQSDNSSDSDDDSSQNVSSEDSSDDLKAKKKKTNKCKNFKEELNRLKVKYELDNADKTPTMNETLKEFFVRTQNFWLSCVDNSTPSDIKTRKKEAFITAEARYAQIKKVYKKHGSKMVPEEHNTNKSK